MNNFRYFPNSKKDIAKLYRFLGIKDKKELFKKILGDIPLISGGDLSGILSDGIDENALLRLFSDIDSAVPSKNKTAVFSGGGIYNHFVPSVIDSLLSRSEFYTPYTPYQPEVSQGTLFALFEFQSFIAEILSMDVVNASMYDGAESLAEAVLTALRLSSANSGMPANHKDDTVLVSEGINPSYFSVIKTFTGGTGVKIEKIKLNAETGRTEISDLKQKLSDENGRVPAVVIQQPNYYGVIEDLESLEKIIHSGCDSNSKLNSDHSSKSSLEHNSSEHTPTFIVSSAEPYSFGIINPPGFYNADIFAGEGNSFGNYMNFGGPLLGLFAAKKEYVRQMPGRIVGKTKDGNNKDAYAFILSTREQHIRRGAATSNICTNSSLNAVRAAIYLSLCSKSGFKDIALLNLKLAHILRDKLLETGLFEPLYGGDFFNEFSLKFKTNVNKHNNKTAAPDFIEKMAARDIIAGIALSDNAVLISATENISLSDIEKYVKNAKEVLNG
jgi:glycine dehydrogenase subunit 1